MCTRKQRIFIWLGMILIQFLPIFCSENFSYSVSHNFILAGDIISNNFLQYLDKFYLIFKIIPLVFIILLICKKKVTKYYLYYVGVMYVIFAIVQNMACVDGYGFGIVTPNIVMCLAMSIMWFQEARINSSEYWMEKKNAVFGALVLLCVIAFWDPPVDHNIQPISLEFTLHNLFFSFSGLAECMMTCIFITVFLFSHKSYNNKPFTVMCMIGIIRAIENVGLALLYINSDRGAALAWLITHTPLMVISIWGYILATLRPSCE